MQNIIIDIPKDFSPTPGGRHINEGLYSGEEFREKILIPKVEQALKDNINITIILDGGYRYAASFLNEVFGGLIYKFNNPELLNIIKFVSDEEPLLIDDIKRYMLDALRYNQYKEKL